MSAPAWIVGGRGGYEPWLHLSQMEGVTLTWHDGGNMGETHFDLRLISLRRGMTPAQRRTTLAHELLHIERGPVCGPSSRIPSRLEERLVELTAALRLVPAFVLDDLDHLVSRHGEEAAAAFLGVDVDVVGEAVDAVVQLRSEEVSA